MDPVFPALTDKRILVTGAARGIGRAVAEEALAAGAQVYAVDILEDELQSLASPALPSLSVARLDLAQVDTFDGVCEDAARVMGGLDCLVHVAAVIVRRTSLDEVTEADWDLQCDVNLKATFFLDRAAATVMRRQGSGGSIVNFSSQGWWTGGFGGSVVYSATKGGVVSLTRGLARSLAGDRIRVNAVAPGAVDTAMMREGLDDAALAAFLTQIPFGRMGEPVELARAALFLASDAASYVTGATLNVSGGQLMY